MMNLITTIYYAVAGQSQLTEEELLRQNVDLQTQIDTIKEQLILVEEDAQRAVDNAEKYSHESIQWGVECARLKAALSEENERHLQLEEEQSIEIESLKAFLDMHDQADPSSLTSQVTDVNDMVEQLALELSCKWELPEERTNHVVDNEVSQYVISAIGEVLFHALGSCILADDGTPSLLQYALQAAILSSVFELFHARYVGVTKDDLLQHITRKVQEGEIQPVYGRWRCITHHRMRLARGTNYDSQSLAHHLKNTLNSVYLVAVTLGLPLSFKDWEELHAEFKTSIDEIGTKVIRLAKSVTEDVVSRDYGLCAPVPGIDFDAEVMETPASLRSSNETKDTVVCATSLGLRSTGKPGREQAKIQEQLLLKPTVLTQSGLNDLMSPPKSRIEEIAQGNSIPRDHGKGTPGIIAKDALSSE